MWPPSIHLSRLLSHTYCCMQFSVAGRRAAADCGGCKWLRRGGVTMTTAAARRGAATRQLSHHPDPSSSFTATASSSAFTTAWTVKSVIFGFTCMQQFLKVYLQRPDCARCSDSIYSRHRQDATSGVSETACEKVEINLTLLTVQTVLLRTYQFSQICQSLR